MHLVKTESGAPGAHPGPACAHRSLALCPGRPCRGCVVACRVPYRRPSIGRVAAVSRACQTMSQRLHGCVVAYPATQPSSQTFACHDTIACIVTRLDNQTARLSRYKDCIVTQPPMAKPSLLSQYKALYRDTHPQPSPVRTHCRPCRRPPGRVAALPWSYHGQLRRVVARPCALPPALPVTIQFVVL